MFSKDVFIMEMKGPELLTASLYLDNIHSCNRVEELEINPSMPRPIYLPEQLQKEMHSD